MQYIDYGAVQARRELFFAETRQALNSYVNPDGSGRIPQFEPPWREVLWILPALYRGGAENIALANRMAARFHSAAPAYQPEIGRIASGKLYNVFLSNTCAGLLAEFHDKLTPEAREVMLWHTRQVFKTYAGGGQSDTKFHGCNDNMPMMCTKGLILGGEFLKQDDAYRQGVWNLNEFRRLLSRSAWESEFNSSNYTPITLSNLARIAGLVSDPAVARLARQCETRLWAELLLHYHPGTRLQGGPNSRSYAPDWVGHTHMTQLLYWLMFGPECSGYDVIRSYFHPIPGDPECIAYGGNRMQNIAEFTDIISADFRIPEELAELFTHRRYPAVVRGRAESMSRYRGCAGEYRTENYMEEEFSLGTVDTPLVSGDATAQLYVTYKRKPIVRDFRDSASVFYRYFTEQTDMSRLAPSFDGRDSSEVSAGSSAFAYTMQKRNVAVMLTIPDVRRAPLLTDTLRLDVIFPAHYGRIRRSLIGNGSCRKGAAGSSAEVVPVSVEAGEVYFHIYPLIPTSLPRRDAVRFEREARYERLALINYEGKKFNFEERPLGYVQNGFVLTVAAASKWKSLEEFHHFHSACRIVDYMIADHRFFRLCRQDVQFELCYTPVEFGVQTRSIDGRTVPLPVFESNQLDASTLPFMTGPVESDAPLFPWKDSMEMHNYPQGAWMIGSRGLPGELPYSRRRADLKLIPTA